MFGMHGRKFVIMAAVITLLTIPKAVLAQHGSVDLSYDEQTSILTVAGSISEEAFQKYNRYITIQIFNPNIAEIGEETDKNVKNALYNFYQLTPDNDGNFTFSAKVEGIHGNCLVKVRMAGNEECLEKTVFIASESEYNAACIEINAQTNISGMREVILKYSDLYSFNHNIQENLLKKDPKGEFLNYISEYILSKVQEQRYTDFKSIAMDFDTELHMWNVLLEGDEGNQIKLLEEYSEYFGLLGNKAYSGQYLGLTENEKKDVMQLLKFANPKNEIEFTESFFKALLLSKLNNMQNWQETGAVISANSEIIPAGIYAAYTSKTAAHTTVHKAVAAEKYKQFDRFIEVFTAAINADAGENKTVYSGGGGGGGSSGSGYYPVIKNDDTQPEENTEKILYNDLAGFEWASEGIYELSGMKILSGRGNGVFSPQDNITREEFVKMLVMACRSYNSEAECSFNDVNQNEWYYHYVASAAEIGIVQGVDENNFGTGQLITRQEMAAMCYRAVMFTSNTKFDNTTPEARFNDWDEISDYASDGVAALYNEKIIQGNANNCFEPLRNAARAEAAVMIYRLILFTR